MKMEYGVFPVEDVFEINKRGVVAAGRVADGTFQEGDAITIHRIGGSAIPSKVLRIEIFGHINYAAKGDNVGLLLENITLSDISKGDIIKRGK